MSRLESIILLLSCESENHWSGFWHRLENTRAKQIIFNTVVSQSPAVLTTPQPQGLRPWPGLFIALSCPPSRVKRLFRVQVHWGKRTLACCSLLWAFTGRQSTIIHIRCSSGAGVYWGPQSIDWAKPSRYTGPHCVIDSHTVVVPAFSGLLLWRAAGAALCVCFYAGRGWPGGFLLTSAGGIFEHVMSSYTGSWSWDRGWYPGCRVSFEFCFIVCNPTEKNQHEFPSWLFLVWCGSSQWPCYSAVKNVDCGCLFHYSWFVNLLISIQSVVLFSCKA